MSHKVGLWEPGSVQPFHRSSPPLSPSERMAEQDDAFQHFLAAPLLWRRAALCGSLHVCPPRTLKATFWGLHIHPL